MALIVVPWFIDPPANGGIARIILSLPCGMVGIALVGAGIIAPFWGTTLTFRRGEPTMEIRLRRITTSRSIFVPIANVVAELVVLDRHDGVYLDGKTGVRLRPNDEGLPAVLLFAGPHGRMLALYRWLTGLIPQSIDRTLERPASGGAAGERRGIPVTRAATGKGGGTDEWGRFAWVTPDRAVLRPTPRMWLVTALVAAAGMGVLLFGVYSLDASDGVIARVATMSVGAVLLVVGLISMVGGAAWRVVVDRVRREIVVRRPSCPWKERRIAFAEVYAMQICSRFVLGTEGANYLTHELNLVLANPEGERINLMSHARLKSIREQADMLSGILSKPLLDDSDERCWIRRK